MRNYQARNFMRDDMQLGDRVLFYHSSADPPCVAGVATVVRTAYPDHTAWNPRDDHFDPKASAENPIWQMVDIKLERIFPQPVPIGALRGVAALAQMELLRTGSRLSVQPVREGEFAAVLRLADELASTGNAKSAAAKSTPRATRAKQPLKKKSRAK